MRLGINQTKSDGIMIGKEWTKREMDVLTEGYRRMNREALQRALPERTWNAIRGKASRLMVHKKPQEEEWVAIIALYPTASINFLARKMGVGTPTADRWRTRLCGC